MGRQKGLPSGMWGLFTEPPTLSACLWRWGGGCQRKVPPAHPKEKQSNLLTCTCCIPDILLACDTLPFAASRANSRTILSRLTSWLSRKKISNLESPNQPVNSQLFSEKSQSVHWLWVPNKETCFSVKSSGPKVRHHVPPRAPSSQRGWWSSHAKATSGPYSSSLSVRTIFM